MNDETYKERCDEVLLSRGYNLEQMKQNVEGSGSETVLTFSDKMTTDEILKKFEEAYKTLTRTNSNKDALDSWFKESLSKVDTKPELSGALVGRNFQLDTFQKNDFKKAKAWLLDHNYPLDLIKGIIDFNIVDLANLMFEAENGVYGKETRDLQDKTQDFNG